MRASGSGPRQPLTVAFRRIDPAEGEELIDWLTFDHWP